MQGDPTQEEFICVICEVISGVIPVDKAGIALYDPEINNLRYFALKGDFQLEYFTVGRMAELNPNSEN